jgi:hypothetical protein
LAIRLKPNNFFSTTSCLGPLPNSAQHPLHQSHTTPSRYLFIGKAKLKTHKDFLEEKTRMSQIILT